MKFLKLAPFLTNHFNSTHRVFNWINQPITLVIIVFSLMIARVLLFYMSSEERLIGVIPDDAFYYIQLAQHRVTDGFWTFDGISPATGFHLFHGYFLVAIFLLVPSIELKELFLLIGTIETISFSISVFLVAKLIGQIFDKKVQFMAIVPFLAHPLYIQSTSLMESWAVVLFSSFSLYAVFRKPSSKDRVWLFVIFLMGIFSSLARTECGLIAGVLFITLFLLKGFKSQHATMKALLLLVGAVIGLAIALLHNYAISGNLLQASAQIKLHWSNIVGHHGHSALYLITKSVMHIYPDMLLFALLTFVAGALVFHSTLHAVRAEYGGIRSDRSAIFHACLITLLGYILLYRYNTSALHHWYTSNFTVPLGIALAGITFYALNKLRFVISSIVLLLYCTSAVFIVGKTPYADQSAMMKAGNYLKDMSDNYQYASWNAGLISYFSGKPVVNLDGLTNDDAIPFILSNRLFNYIIDRKINYIVDFDAMFRQHNRIRGGYDDPRVDSCIHLEKTIGDNWPEWDNSIISLYSVDLLCKKNP